MFKQYSLFDQENRNKSIKKTHDNLQKTIASILKFKGQTDCYASISGGKGSTVLADIIERFELDIPFTCVPSCEESENIKIANMYNPTYVNGKYTFKEIISRWGYPLISKQTSMAISRYRNTKSQRVRDKRLNGEIKDGKSLKAGTIPKKYHFMIYAPFEVSEQCCEKRKKGPLKKYAKQNNRLPITAEMATESESRMRQFQKNGCIIPGKKNTPMAMWTDADLDNYINFYKVKISDLYVSNTNQRTGCPECGFGYEYDRDRYKRIPDPTRRYKTLMGGEFVETDKYRLIKECYTKLDRTVTKYDTSSKRPSDFKKAISRVVKVGGLVISCGYDSNGIGKSNGFEVVEGLNMHHGGAHYDSIITIERKIQGSLF